ncbi:LapA family protein [Phreatobacter sp. AB_2022a]|uniref:LapA family protein n=1 Tax=Phreatobacter sp. AB_2022a TaxID=3003134 RepID=UPI0022872B24|nr:LapA family protein [Phreatobacter sp. AB_2022a]MCZ0734652.1 LapA family protein [Phreatobacter sp. AB_2022a]
MIKSIVNWLVLVPVAIVVVVLAVANRTPVTFSLDPFSRDMAAAAVTVPLFVLVLAAVALGVLIGGIVSWFKHSPQRRLARKAEADLAAARAEIERLRAEIARAGGTPPVSHGGPLSFFGRPAA